MKANNNCSGVDGRCCRLWCPPEKCTTNPQWKKIQKCPHIFLVHRPLTFGHSQLVVPITPKLKELSEEKLFEEASKDVKKAIATFEKVFKDTSILKEFKVLAEFTHTTGDYIKTLILRTSADENCDEEYKVHLVPYFESHADDCEKLHQFLHHKISGTGSLLGWLGKREYDVDCWGIEQEKKHLRAFEDIVIKDYLKIHELAEILRKEI